MKVCGLFVRNEVWVWYTAGFVEGTGVGWYQSSVQNPEKIGWGEELEDPACH